jgi:recombination protein RecT
MQNMQNVSKVNSKSLVDRVANNIKIKLSEGRIVLPNDYRQGNALAQAILEMQQAKNYHKSTESSKAEALLDMVLLAHYPKKHGYFIVYENRMTWFPKYTGKMYTINRALDLEINASVIYEKDEVDYTIKNGIISEIIHKQKFQNIDSNNIIGAYAIATNSAGKEKFAEIMTMEQIQQAWDMSKFNKTKKTFREQYAKRSVINRLTTHIIETSKTDSNLMDIIQQNEHKHYNNNGNGNGIIEDEIIDTDVSHFQEIEHKQEQTIINPPIVQTPPTPKKTTNEIVNEFVDAAPLDFE